jgi:hypothetical protein
MIFQHGLPPVVGGAHSTLQEEKMLSNQCVEVDGCTLMSMMGSMSNNNQKEMTIAELAKEMHEGFKTMRQEIRSEVKEERSHMKEYVQQGFEAMNENIGGVEKRLTYKIEAFEDRTFSPDEKESILDTVKLINDHWGEGESGKGHITLTREEYEAASQAQGFPNRFIGVPLIDIE